MRLAEFLILELFCHPTPVYKKTEIMKLSLLWTELLCYLSIHCVITGTVLYMSKL